MDEVGDEQEPVDGGPAREPDPWLSDEWDVEEAWDLDPFAEDGCSGAEGVTRERVASALAVLDVDTALIAAKQARAVVAYAEIAAGWACPHAQDVVAPDWAQVSRQWIHEGPLAGMSIGGAHAGYHGVCEESIAAFTTVLAARQGGWSRGYAGAQIRSGIRLCAVLPATLAAWSAGRLDGRQVAAVIRGLDVVVDDDLAREADARLCGDGVDGLVRTRGLTVGALGGRVRAVVAEVDAAAVARRSRRAVAARSVRVTDEGEGIARLEVRGPAPAVQEMAAVLRAAGAASKAEARRANRAGEASRDPWAIPGLDGPLDARGIDAHRFDAAHAIITGALAAAKRQAEAQQAAEDGASSATSSSWPASSSTGGTGQLVLPVSGLEARLGELVAGWSGTAHLPAVLVGLSTLAGRDGAPAMLDGYGAIPGWMAQAMLHHRGLRRFITDPLTGHLSYLGTHTYTPGTLDGLADLCPDPEPDPPDDDSGGNSSGGGGDEEGPPDHGGGGPGEGGGGGGGPGGGGSPPGGTSATQPATLATPAEPATPAPPPTPTPAPAAAPSGCVPLDPGDCPVRVSGLAALAAGHPGARPSGRWAPSPALAAFVRRAWRHCSAPGCTRIAAACELDHTIRWPEGTTCACDLAPLCAVHHLTKHHSPTRGGGPAAAWAARAGTMPWRWSLHRCSAGHQHWTTPLGEQHTVTPTPSAAPTRHPTTTTDPSAGTADLPPRAVRPPRRASDRQAPRTDLPRHTTLLGGDAPAPAAAGGRRSPGLREAGAVTVPDRSWVPLRRPPLDDDAALAAVREVVAAGPFTDTWESLAGYQVPSWFADAKLGIFIHWGAFSVPAFDNEWYPRTMYEQGSAAHAHHLATYGDHAQHGYKDFFPSFTMEHFDPADLAALARRSGAQYVVPVAEHHDGLALYDEPRTRWNSLAVGPHRDLLGELLEAADDQALVRGASSHRAEHWFYFHPGTAFDSDVRDPAYADLYGPAQPQEAGPSDAHLQDWLLRTVRIIDRYRPQVLWFDWWLEHPAFEPWLRLLAAYYYDRAAQWGRGVVLAYKWGAFRPGTALADVERGTSADISPVLWQNDTSTSRTSWGWIEGHDHKSVVDLLSELVDVVAKNGCLLLNIGPKPDGSVADAERALLEGLGDWLAVNGEAIYGTRPWRVAGEGPTTVAQGSFTDAQPLGFTAADVRFTQRRHEGATDVYATGVVWPADGVVRLRTLGRAGAPALPPGAAVASVHLLGHGEPLEFEAEQDALVVHLPDRRPSAHGFSLRLTVPDPAASAPRRLLITP